METPKASDPLLIPEASVETGARSSLEDITNQQRPGQEGEEAQMPQDADNQENLVLHGNSSVGDNSGLDEIEEEVAESEDTMSTISNDSTSLEGNIEEETDEQPGPTPGQVEPTLTPRLPPLPVPIQPLRPSADYFDLADDPLQAWPYAMDIFNYLKEREKAFAFDDYMPRQVNLTALRRTMLVNWMVTVQLGYGMFNETLYLSVKIVDLYLCREVIEARKMQLLGATAIYIACKYEESDALQIYDLLDICEEKYDNAELVEMERRTLRNINFDLGIPISYRFLRRYARCANVPIPTWILASYILEMSLMDYAAIAHSDSQMASAALFMALRMHGQSEQLDEHTWNPALVHYSGYELSEFAPMVPVLNAGLHRTDWTTVRAIRNKYTQYLLYEVALVPLLTDQELFRDNPGLVGDFGTL